jgi:hypothetical protein
MFANCQDVAVVLCSTYRRTDGPRLYEVLVGTADGFTHDTLIDCRWPYTVNKQIPGMNLQPLFCLSPDVMLQVFEAPTSAAWRRINGFGCGLQTTFRFRRRRAA